MTRSAIQVHRRPRKVSSAPPAFVRLSTVSSFIWHALAATSGAGNDLGWHLPAGGATQAPVHYFWNEVSRYSEAEPVFVIFRYLLRNSISWSSRLSSNGTILVLSSPIPAMLLIEPINCALIAAGSPAAG